MDPTPPHKPGKRDLSGGFTADGGFSGGAYGGGGGKRDLSGGFTADGGFSGGAYGGGGGKRDLSADFPQGERFDVGEWTQQSPWPSANQNGNQQATAKPGEATSPSAMRAVASPGNDLIRVVSGQDPPRQQGVPPTNVAGLINGDGTKFTNPHGQANGLGPTPQQNKNMQNIMSGGVGAITRQENPQAHRECCEIQGFERFLSELKNELASIFNRDNKDGQGVDGMPEIGPLSIDQDSIQKLTQAIKEALAEQFANLIKQLSEKSEEGGNETATLSGRLDHSHKMNVDVNGTIQVAEIQNIEETIKKILRQQLGSMNIANNTQLAEGIGPASANNGQGGSAGGV
jgi:hypothetical protein